MTDTECCGGFSCRRVTPQFDLHTFPRDRLWVRGDSDVPQQIMCVKGKNSEQWVHEQAFGFKPSYT
jgi:hypothetical protein